MAAKEKGNAAYKAKKFDEALKFYNEAINLDPTDMTYLNNTAGKCTAGLYLCAKVTHGAKNGGSFSEMMGPSISNLPQLMFG